MVNDFEPVASEYGAEEINLSVFQAHGPGSCPLCGSNTILTSGEYGRFYGCVNFPDCCGSRQVKIIYILK